MVKEKQMVLKIYNRDTGYIKEQSVLCTYVGCKNGQVQFSYKHPHTGNVQKLITPVTNW